MHFMIRENWRASGLTVFTCGKIGTGWKCSQWSDWDRLTNSTYYDWSCSKISETIVIETEAQAAKERAFAANCETDNITSLQYWECDDAGYPATVKYMQILFGRPFNFCRTVGNVRMLVIVRKRKRRRMLDLTRKGKRRIK